MPILEAPIQEHVAERLASDTIVWLTSVRADGRPHIVPVWFFWDGTTFLILSQPGNQKVRNIRRDARVALALDDSRLGRDVMIFEGEAELLDEPTSQVAPPDYWAKYTEHLRHMNWDPAVIAAEYSQPIQIRPTRFITF